MNVRFLLLYPSVVLGLLFWSYLCHRVYEQGSRWIRQWWVRRYIRLENESIVRQRLDSIVRMR